MADNLPSTNGVPTGLLIDIDDESGTTKNCTKADKADVDGASAEPEKETKTDPMPNSAANDAETGIYDIGDHIIKQAPWPPYIAVGPPGTGKSESLGYRCVSMISAWGQNVYRILIVARSDSCADEFILNIFDGNPDVSDITINRVYTPGTQTSTIHEEVAKYAFIAGDVTYMPDIETLNESNIIITTFDMIDKVYQPKNDTSFTFTHILLDDIQTFPFPQLCEILANVPAKTCVALTMSTLLDHQTRRLISHTDITSATSNRERDDFLQTLQTIIGSPDNFTPFQLDYVDRMCYNFSYSSDMLDFVNLCLMGQDEMTPTGCTITENMEAVCIHSVLNNDPIEQIAEHVDCFYKKWPDTWSDPRPCDLAIVTEDQQQLDLVRAALICRSDQYKTMCFYTVDAIGGLFFNAVFLLINPLTDSDAIPEWQKSTTSVVSALTRARSHLAVFIDDVTINILSQSVSLWKGITDFCEQKTFDAMIRRDANVSGDQDSLPEYTDYAAAGDAISDEITDFVAPVNGATGDNYNVYGPQTNDYADSLSDHSDYGLEDGYDSDVSDDFALYDNDFNQDYRFGGQFIDAEEDGGTEFQFSSCFWNSPQVVVQSLQSPDPWNEIEPTEPPPVPISSTKDSDSDGPWSGSRPSSDDDMTFRTDHPVEHYDNVEESVWMESKVVHYSTKNKNIRERYPPRDLSSGDEAEPAEVIDEDLMYPYPIEHNPDAIDEVNERFDESYQLPEPMFSGRQDYRSMLTITIGEGDDRTLAYSAARQPSGDICFTIHVSDVTEFVAKDSELDRDAAYRNYTLFIPGKPPVYILPDRLSTDLCSFLCGKDRLAWSVIITTDSNYKVKNIDTDVDMKRSMINVDKAFTHDDVDNHSLGNLEVSEDLHDLLDMLNHFSKMQRFRRLGNASVTFNSIECISLSVILVSEITIFINYYVSLRLLRTYDDVTPLLNHAKIYCPSTVTGWRKRYADISRQSLSLSYRYLSTENPRYLNTTDLVEFSACKCEERCTCVPIYNIDQFSQAPKDVCEISKSRWSKVTETYETKAGTDLKIVLADVLNYPETTLALHELSELKKNDVYFTAIDINRGHHPLNLSTYTTFTQPLQRFIDIVIQRMLLYEMLYMDLAYSSDDIDDFCYRATEDIKKGREAEFCEYLHRVTSALKHRPLKVEMIVSKLDNKELQLANPLALYSPSTLDTSRDIRYKPSRLLDETFEVQLNSLMLCEKPAITDGDLTIKWQERIYSLGDKPNIDPLIVTPGEFYQIYSNYLVKCIPFAAMEKLAIALRSGDEDSMKQATKVISDYPDTHKQSELSDVSSDMLRTEANEPAICNISAVFHVGTTVQVHLASGVNKAASSVIPMVQLLTLTPTIDICIEHNLNKARSFVATPVDRVDDDSYFDLKEYKRRWLAILKYEAAESAISENDGIIIHGVAVSWSGTEERDAHGQFILPKSFTDQHMIPRGGFICVRYKNMTANNEGINKSVRGLFSTQDTFTWVGHCCVLDTLTKTVHGSEVARSEVLEVNFKLFSSCVTMPPVLLEEKGKGLTCTIQWVDTPRPHGYMISAVERVGGGGMRDSLFGGTLKVITDYKEPRELDMSKYPSNRPLNREQIEAITKAMSSNFALIHGPPGTGKTATAARLVYLFVKRNEINGFRKKGEQWQVMYCAPSNKAADVILGYFRDMRSEHPVVIRNYSNRIECHDFGTPEQIKAKESSNFEMKTAHKRFALHHVIRERMKPHAKEILSMDRKIRKNPELITREFMEKYREVVLTACRIELEKAEVIVTTCTGCVSSRFNVTRIRQVVVDEAGMCSQPETLIPVSKQYLKQVTLIGDHKQLQPVLITDPAKDLGMLRSMFERYSEKAVMLTTQYRMHEAIAAVPSHSFYDDKLRCGNREQTSPSSLAFWPGGPSMPITFCHVIGSEQVTTVSTRESNDRSKSNRPEAEITQKIADRLIMQHGIKPDKIAILTQYRSQHAIIESLVLPDHPKVTINTVIASQGDEWDYVILSTVRTVSPDQIYSTPSPAWIRKNLGFIADEHQINVALTRAKKGLIIVGNKKLLKCHPLWKELITFYRRNKALVDAEEFLQTL